MAFTTHNVQLCLPTCTPTSPKAKKYFKGFNPPKLLFWLTPFPHVLSDHQSCDQYHYLGQIHSHRTLDIQGQSNSLWSHKPLHSSRESSQETWVKQKLKLRELWGSVWMTRFLIKWINTNHQSPQPNLFLLLNSLKILKQHHPKPKKNSSTAHFGVMSLSSFTPNFSGLVCPSPESLKELKSLVRSASNHHHALQRSQLCLAFKHKRVLVGFFQRKYKWKHKKP